MYTCGVFTLKKAKLLKNYIIWINFDIKFIKYEHILSENVKLNKPKLQSKPTEEREREYVKDKYGTGECNPFKAERSEAKFFLNPGGKLKKKQKPNEID